MDIEGSILIGCHEFGSQISPLTSRVQSGAKCRAVSMRVKIQLGHSLKTMWRPDKKLQSRKKLRQDFQSLQVVGIPAKNDP